MRSENYTLYIGGRIKVESTKISRRGSMTNKQLRFGGMSPTVLRELSGVYQPFVKAIKEILSNSYDADATQVNLVFSPDYSSLKIKDNGIGMNPIEFIHQYIRIGKSYLKKGEYTPKFNRPRIGGKGIGFLAPARYCSNLVIKTKKGEKSINYFTISENNENEVDVRQLFLQGHNEEKILDYISITKITDQNSKEIEIEKEQDFVIYFKNPVSEFNVWYEFDSRSMELFANIDFNLLFSLDSNKSLEDIDNFCEFSIREVPIQEKNSSYTSIELQDIKDFTKAELFKVGKKGAKNIESTSGINQFMWNLSRIIPVEAKIHSNIPSTIRDLLINEIDSVTNSKSFRVFCSYDGQIDVPLLRYIIEPGRKFDSINDADLFEKIEIDNDNYLVKGFILGQNTTIFPGEARGILLRVKGVAVGEPTYFGLDQILTGSAKVALSQISGEINFIKGIDAIKDINPGREGFYKESKLYNFIKEILIGKNPEKPSGSLKKVIDSIISRSEINASINNFIKKHQSQRKSILDISTAISESAFEDPFIFENFSMDKTSYDLLLQPAVKYKAEGKLATYVVELVDDIKDDYKIDYVNKKLLLNKDADLWKKNVSIGGKDFEIILKHGKKTQLLCEVHPTQNKIYINWDHPIKSSMGEGDFIKHCIAVIAVDLPQDKLNAYNKIFGNKTR